MVLSRIVVYGLFLLNFVMNLFAQSQAARTDTYHRISVLTDSLRQWQVTPPAIRIPEVRVDGNIRTILQQYTVNVDTLSSTHFRLQASLGPYLGMLSTQLHYDVTLSGEEWEVEDTDQIRTADSLFYYDDSSTAALIGMDTLSPGQRDVILDRLQLYRTAGVPQLFTRALAEGVITPRVIIHGRALDSLEYEDMENWIATLRYLARDKLVYAGPLFLHRLPDSLLHLKFYLSMTTASARGHHFLLIDEVFLNDGDMSTIRYRVHFYPYIRVDNIRNLYQDPRRSTLEDKIPVRVR